MYKELTRHWTPTVDLFAHTTNAKCKKFYSYGNAPHSARVDAFTRDWSNEIAWVCPPVYMIIETVKKIEESRMHAIVCIPAWRSAAFWTVVFPDGKQVLEIRRPWIVRGKFCTNKLLQGRTKFPFIVMYIRSAGLRYTGRSGRLECPDF